jgi:beta-glucosidase
MTNGLVSLAMVDGLLLIVNGHSFRGIGAFLRAFVVNVRTSRGARRGLAAPRS